MGPSPKQLLMCLLAFALGRWTVAVPLSTRGRHSLAERRIEKSVHSLGPSPKLLDSSELPNMQDVLSKLNKINVTLNEVDGILSQINDTAQDLLVDQVAIGVQAGIMTCEGAKAAAKALEQFGVFEAGKWINQFVDTLIGFIAELQGKLGGIHTEIGAQLHDLKAGFGKAYYFFMEKFVMALVKIEEFGKLVDNIEPPVSKDLSPNLARSVHRTDLSALSALASSDHLAQMKAAVVNANETVAAFVDNVLLLNTTAYSMMGRVYNESTNALQKLNNSCVGAIGDAAASLPSMLADQVSSVCGKPVESALPTIKSKTYEVVQLIKPKLDKALSLVPELYGASDALALRLYGMVAFVETAKAQADAFAADEEASAKAQADALAGDQEVN